MLDSRFREIFSSRFKNVTVTLAALGITPMQLTICGFIMGITAAILLIVERPFIALTVWLISRVIDGFDGMLARYLKVQSFLGGFADITCDMFAYGMMILGFYHLHPDWVWLWILLSYISVITTTLALAPKLDSMNSKDNRIIKLAPGLAEAGETSMTYCALVLISDYWLIIAWCWVVLLFITIIQKTLLAVQIGSTPTTKLND